MASTQLSPGVVVLERDLSNVVNATVDNIGAIAGVFEKGPVEQVVSIGSEKELLAVFGRPNDNNYDYWFSAAQFLLYGGTCKIVRATNDSLKNAIDTATFTVTSFSATDTTLTVKSATDFTAADVLLIDAELLEVTAVSGLDVTVTRGQLSTSAASHAAGASITLIEATASVTQVDMAGDVTFTDNGTTLTVADVNALNVSLNDYVRIDNEFLQVTAIAGNDLTVVRGALGSTAAAHVHDSDVTLQTVSSNKTQINEKTSTGVTAPLIKNLDEYESNVESAANNYKWAARTPGSYANSLRIVMTDAGADQILYLNEPEDGTEYVFAPGNAVNYAADNVYGKVYGYRVILKLKSTGLKGDFVAGNAFTYSGDGSDTVVGTVVAWDKVNRELEIDIDVDGSNDVLEINDKIEEDTTSTEGLIETISRELLVALDNGSPRFATNYTIDDFTSGTAQTATIQNTSIEYEERLYGSEQRWINIAPKPTTSNWAQERGGFRDQIHILVLDGDGQLTGTPGSVLEKFLFLSKSSDAKGPQGESLYYKDVIRERSEYIYWGSHESSQTYDSVANNAGSFGLSGINKTFDLIKSTDPIKSLDDPDDTNALAVPLVGTKNNATTKYSLQGGVDGYNVSRTAIMGAYDLYSDPETEDVDYLICGPLMSTTTDSVAKAQKLITIANDRKDCIAFISPARYDVIGQPSVNVIVDKTLAFFDQLSSSSYSVFDNNFKYIYDRYNDKYRYIPCNADVAGLTLNTTLNFEPWFSPAGFNRGTLLNAIKLAYSPLKNDRDRLYASRINPVVAFPGQGIVLFGDKTALSYQSAFDRINVRRLFLVMEEAIADAAKSQLFELNDEFTRSAFRGLVDPFLRGVQARRGIVDFLVVCDETNNPPDAIDRGEFFAEIFVKPTRSINFITLTFTATRTGASFSEVAS